MKKILLILISIFVLIFTLLFLFTFLNKAKPKLSTINYSSKTEENIFQNNIFRTADGNILYSAKYPHLLIELDSSFVFFEHFNFRINDIADCERFIFIDPSPDKRINRLFIAQFESILPSSNVTYNYSFENAIEIDGIKFNSNLFAFSNEAAMENNPDGEASRTFKLLKEHGFTIDDKWITSRFVTVPDMKRKHELIMFYVENLSDTGYKIEDLYTGKGYTEIGSKLAEEMKEKAQDTISIHNLDD
jgi:hypothetical protein